ncbi:MAG TPA: cupin domain-containing protein [Candidatus Binatia bacterium]|jgi:mannose-6-phosphate isomerase-like protein (cupin superfamily)
MAIESNLQAFKHSKLFLAAFKSFHFQATFQPFQQFKPFKPSDGLKTVCARGSRFVCRASRWITSFSALIILPWLVACSAPPKIVLNYGTEFTQSDLTKVLAENPLALNEDVRLTTLGQTADASQHIVQIRNREIPHTHNSHDSTVFMLRGHGYLVMDGRRIDLAAGDIIHIPRGVPHYYVNTASDPTVAFVVFSPPFDGKDNVPLTAR